MKSGDGPLCHLIRLDPDGSAAEPDGSITAGFPRSIFDWVVGIKLLLLFLWAI